MQFGYRDYKNNTITTKYLRKMKEVHVYGVQAPTGLVEMFYLTHLIFTFYLTSAC